MNGTVYDHERAKDRRLNVLLVASLVTLVAVIVFALIAVPKILNNETATKAVSRSNELQACRAQFRVDVDDASSQLQQARARLDVLTNQGLASSVARDEAALLTAVTDSIAARDEVIATAAELDRVTDRYGELVALSRTGEDKFLDLCRQEKP